MELAAAYDPAVLPVQLNLLGSHDTPGFERCSGGASTGSGSRRCSR